MSNSKKNQTEREPKMIIMASGRPSWLDDEDLISAVTINGDPVPVTSMAWQRAAVAPWSLISSFAIQGTHWAARPIHAGLIPWRPKDGYADSPPADWDSGKVMKRGLKDLTDVVDRHADWEGFDWNGAHGIIGYQPLRMTTIGQDDPDLQIDPLGDKPEIDIGGPARITIDGAMLTVQTTEYVVHIADGRVAIRRL